MVKRCGSRTLRCDPLPQSAPTTSSALGLPSFCEALAWCPLRRSTRCLGSISRRPLACTLFLRGRKVRVSSSLNTTRTMTTLVASGWPRYSVRIALSNSRLWTLCSPCPRLSAPAAISGACTRARNHLENRSQLRLSCCRFEGMARSLLASKTGREYKSPLDSLRVVFPTQSECMQRPVSLVAAAGTIFYW